MKKFLLLVILGAAAWYGWKYYQELPAPSEETAVEDAGPEQEETPERGAADLQAQLQQQQKRQDSALPDELATQKQEADQLWQSILDEQGKPPLDQRAPLLSKQYSAVLRGLYEVPDSESAQQELIEERLRPLAEALFFSTMKYSEDPTGFFAVHTIESGQLLDSIGREYGISYQMLNIMRGVDPESSSYPQGLRIKVFHGKEEGYLLHIDKSSFVMDAFIGGLFAKRFPIGIGKETSETPVGTTYIDARERGQEGVQWTDPETGATYQAGQEGNILGRYWLRFHPQIGRSGLGIHGYTGEGTVTGAKVSNGCIRMRNEDAALVYNMLVPCLYGQDGIFITRAPMIVTIVE